MKFTLITLLALASSAMAAGNLEDNNLRDDLVYDASDGNVELHIFDLTGTGPIVQFSLGTDSAFDLTDGLVMQGLDCGLILPAVPCGTDTVISYDDPTLVGFGGVLDLGRILPSGLTGTGVQDFLTEASYRTEHISTLTEFDIRVVPEPSGMLILLFGLLGLQQQRVWRSRAK